MATRTRRDQAQRRGTPSEVLVIGLGNPGSTYEGTRHNVGFDVVERLATRHSGHWTFHKKLRSRVVEHVSIAGHRVSLAEPQTYMNDSGLAAQLLIRRFGIQTLNQLIVVHDELDLPLGRMKVKEGGGLAGHNGLRSLRDHLHGTDFLRVRIGVGKPVSKDHGVDHVLTKLTKRDAKMLGEMVDVAADAVETVIESGVEVAMTAFNGTDRSDSA